MNRSIVSIVAGGFGGTSVASATTGAGGTVRATTASDVAIQLAYAGKVVIVPGYGLAASQAQYAMREMTKLLEANGVDVTYAIHPVAGRMPGHITCCSPRRTSRTSSSSRCATSTPSSHVPMWRC